MKAWSLNHNHQSASHVYFILAYQRQLNWMSYNEEAYEQNQVRKVVHQSCPLQIIVANSFYQSFPLWVLQSEKPQLSTFFSMIVLLQFMVQIATWGTFTPPKILHLFGMLQNHAMVLLFITVCAHFFSPLLTRHGRYTVLEYWNFSMTCLWYVLNHLSKTKLSIESQIAFCAAEYTRFGHESAYLQAFNVTFARWTVK